VTDFRRFAILPVATIGLGLLPIAWFHTSTPAISAPIPVTASGGSQVSVLTLNLAKVTEVSSIVKELRPADVYLFQEVVRADAKSPSVAHQVAEKLGMNAQFATADTGATSSGIAILSRYQLSDVETHAIKPVNLIFRSRKRVILAATVQTPQGPARMICAHLDTRINPIDRIRQLEPAIADAKRFNGPALIGGDLNTNDMQWVSHVVPVPWPGWQAARIRDLMAQSGFHTPFVNRRATFDHLGMQLDWIFLRNLAAVKTDIVPVEFSDHHALVTSVGLTSR
jgi:endonuclease/exonuclease/phosphatase family metal-dependent hydrolase